MPFLSYNRAIQLRQVLKDTQATVVTPEQEGYPELISRWSEASEKEAVGLLFFYHLTQDTTSIHLSLCYAMLNNVFDRVQL
jgi:hypothetical protein